MSFNLLEAARSLLPGNIISRVAISLGETEPNTRKAINSAIPSILAGLLHQSTAGGPAIFDLLKSVKDSGAINHLDELFNSKKIAETNSQAASISKLIPGWLRSVFGSKLINIVNATTIYSDIKSSSASAILNLATPLVLTAVARYAEENKLGTAELDNFFQSQKSSILSAIPVGFNLTGSLGVNSLNDIGTKIVTAVPEPHDYPRSRGNAAAKWIWPFLLLATFGGLIWFFSQRDSDEKAANTTTKDTATKLVDSIPANTTTTTIIQGRLDSLTGNYIYDHGIMTNLLLPDSSVMQAGQSSTEARLFYMLSDTSWHIDTIDKTKNWITFDRVFFETGKSILTAESQTQVKNIATILKYFPNSSIKIGGYTDNAGDSIVNKKVSEERAKTVMHELIKLGAGANQITEAVGYGAEHPVCPANDTPDCKARNRRVDLKVAVK